MFEQMHTMCCQQINEMMMMMMTNETHETVLMQMNYTNTTAEELETIPLCSTRAPISLILLYASTVWSSNLSTT